jgi:hypothetical protein
MMLDAPLQVDVIVGAPGVVYGVALETADDVPEPPAFTARSAMPYVVPFVRPEMVNGEVVDAGLSVVHVEPEFVEYS